MSLQQVVPPRTSANGLGRRKVGEAGNRMEHKPKSNPNRSTNANLHAGNRSTGAESPIHERLLFITACLIGHNVEVQVKDGSIFSGIFHATNAEPDFGIILKMARSIRTGPHGIKSMLDSISKAPSKQLIISAKELVQITAKDVPVTNDGITDDLQQVKHHDLMIDSSISRSRQVEVERELERWVPDENAPHCVDLENTFDAPWNRGWDQFEANKTLFGVKSTYDEDLYTTKLEKGPLMKDLEREASRIAREIEGEDTQDLHLAEERGKFLYEKFGIDEETRYSSVYRGVDDSGYAEEEDFNSSSFDFTRAKNDGEAKILSQSSFTKEAHTPSSSSFRDAYQFGSSEPTGSMSFESLKRCSASDDDNRAGENQRSDRLEEITKVKDFDNKSMPIEGHVSKKEGLLSSPTEKKDGIEKAGLSASATAYAPTSHGPSKSLENAHSSELAEDASVKSLVTHPASSTSPAPQSGGGASASSVGAGLSPSSSTGTLSSEKSTLNPHAKEFKFNPNARSFIPSQAPIRPASPVPEGPFYFPNNVAGVGHMPAMPVGIGIGHSFAHQPVVFNPPVAPMQSPQGYYHPSGPQYGQQMVVGPRPFVYMPAAYTPEMPYKGRDY
ncbi:polyadenylate-binding protein-interacting protein 3-like isoform X2 [Impatiens glandulifera]|uniref:polyadenylate-binding protein-interacting protein 3-like isoform X2 n=1 Tax=Impatiens glandulifera TaxID=253017 RepID=UPI001FB11C4C|nr:polyadenylate-binding protein-interacting protein 3-like isoform X2 [Impatiens glandulifera]